MYKCRNYANNIKNCNQNCCIYYFVKKYDSNRILNVAAYWRVSTDDEDRLNSYRTQKVYYTEHIKKIQNGALRVYMIINIIRYLISGIRVTENLNLIINIKGGGTIIEPIYANVKWTFLKQWKHLILCSFLLYSRREKTTTKRLKISCFKCCSFSGIITS